MGDYEVDRALMVARHLRARGITDERVLAVMGDVPREEFVPAGWHDRAYGDHAISIGQGQTISQPWIVARMCELLHMRGDERVLDVGTGSGYLAAVLSRLSKEVVSIERIRELGATAAERLQRLGYDNVRVIVGDGTLGYPPAAPYDRIVVSAATAVTPPSLLQQLAPGGRLLIPVGPRGQQLLTLYEVRDGRLFELQSDPCIFVPLVDVRANALVH